MRDQGDTAGGQEVRWHPGEVGRQVRWAALGRIGATVWFTGLPASGKSTIAAAVERRLIAEWQIPAFRLDGDNLRHGLNSDLGFSAADRAENVRRVAEVARLFADSGMLALASLISPYAEGRRQARALHEELGLHFVEVYVKAPLEECERRDPKGLYARARAGEITGLTGVDDVFEPPQRAELELPTKILTIDAAVERVLSLLIDTGIVPKSHIANTV